MNFEINSCHNNNYGISQLLRFGSEIDSWDFLREENLPTKILVKVPLNSELKTADIERIEKAKLRLLYVFSDEAIFLNLNVFYSPKYSQEDDMLVLIPTSLITPKRFDLVIKEWSSHLISLGIRDEKSIYGRHLFMITGFNRKIIEYGNTPEKKGFTAFADTFSEILHAKFPYRERVPIIKDGEGYLIQNGAHRTAASINRSKMLAVTLENLSRGRIDSSRKFFSSRYFGRRIIKDKELDALAHRYTMLKPTTCFIVLFPSILNSKRIKKEIEERLGSNIVAKKGVYLPTSAEKYLLKILYSIKIEINNQHKVFNNLIRDRFRIPGKTFFYSMDNIDFQELRKFKADLREKFHLPAGSIHTSDSYEESLSISELIFTNKINRFARNYNGIFADPPILDLGSTTVALTGGSVLQALGIRKASDTDYICLEESKVQNLYCNAFECHNTYFSNLGINVRRLFNNPSNFFYAQNVLYLNVINLLKFKIKRRERKDLKDFLTILLIIISNLITLWRVFLRPFIVFILVLRAKVSSKKSMKLRL